MLCYVMLCTWNGGKLTKRLESEGEVMVVSRRVHNCSGSGEMIVRGDEVTRTNFIDKILSL